VTARPSPADIDQERRIDGPASAAGGALRVAVDATAIPARLTGAGVYTARLLAALAARGDVDLDAFVAPHAEAALATPGVRAHRVGRAGRGRPARIAWTQLAAGRAARRTGARVLHGVHYELPLSCQLPQIVTVHDLTLLTHPEWHEASKVAYFGWALRRALRRAARVLCVSATTADDLIRVLHVDPSRIDVTPLGTDLAPAPPEAVAAVRARLGLARPYLLGLGTLEPRKDLPTLIAAFGTLAKDLPHDLVLAGLPGWGSGEVAAALDALDGGVADRVRLAGYIPEEDKAALFTGAELFAYPSRYEGFGLPVAEAMACGVPVVTTTGGSLPEVAGDGAELVAPGDADALAAAIRKLLDDRAARDELVRRGRARAAQLTWARCAALTAAAYRRAVDVGG
jgi:glycosyltransferase involved in cell wall biosynthesis